MNIPDGGPVTAPVLEIEDLHKSFRTDFYRRRVHAVRGVSFRVEEGEILGLLGPNGAGKTTTIKCIVGLVSPTRGRVRLMGEDARHASARRALGYLPENPYFHEYLTPREILGLHAQLAGLGRHDARDRVEELLARVDLVEASDRPLRRLSRGMMQRLGLAQAIVARPRLLVLDEPMGGLDPIGRKLASDLVAELNRQGTTIMFSSHILSDVERLCHRVVIVNRGRVAAEGRLEDLLRGEAGTETLESLFLRKAIDVSDECPRA